MFRAGAIVAAAAAFLAGPALVRAETRIAAGLVVEVPAGWTVAVDGTLLSVSHPQGDVSLQFITLPERDIDRAIKRVDGQMKKSFQGVKWDAKARKLKLNGMRAFTLDGDAKLDKQALRLGVTGIKTPGGRVLMVLVVADAARAAASSAAVTAVIAGLKPEPKQPAKVK